MKKYFEGWYFKHQKNGQTLALIPGRSNDSAFIQVITNDRSYYIKYSLTEYEKSKFVRVGNSVFSRNKIKIDINSEDIILKGKLIYSEITPLKNDIMGPFVYFPMECRHTVISLHHTICGRLNLNGQALDFDGGIGYIEADSGCSFPEYYTWVQSNDFDEKCSVMVSFAKIPFLGFKFNGCICSVWYGGQEYRIATYLGAKVTCSLPNRLVLVQGQFRIEIDVSDQVGHTLAAPELGQMSRTIHECNAVKARFRFYIGNKVLFDKYSNNTSFERII